MTLWEILRAQRFAHSDDLFAMLEAEKLNGGRTHRNTIIIQHGKGEFKATAEGNKVVWKYGAQEIHGSACQFTVTEDNAQILVSFDGLLTKFENRSDAQTLLDLSDLGGRLSYYLNLYDCKNITGSLADLMGGVTYYLNLYNCKNITGSLADLGGRLEGTLSLSGCPNITGSLADLGGKLIYFLGLNGCKNITGVYSGDSYPTNVNLSYTGLTAADMDQTLTNFNAGTTKSGTFTANGMTRTAASDAAVAGLIAKGWTVSGLTKSEESV